MGVEKGTAKKDGGLELNLSIGSTRIHPKTVSGQPSSVVAPLTSQRNHNDSAQAVTC